VREKNLDIVKLMIRRISSRILFRERYSCSWKNSLIFGKSSGSFEGGIFVEGRI